MEFLTMIIRWRRSPKPHICVPQMGSRWYVARLTLACNKNVHLTVVCVHAAAADIPKHIDTLKKTIKNLWCDPDFALLGPGDYEELLEHKAMPVGLLNHYVINRTPAERRSFYQHVTNTVKPLAPLWIHNGQLPVADSETFFKLFCKHVPHTIQVRPTFDDSVYTVRCDEPQTIYELMERNGIPCSFVSNMTMSLSAKSPCLSLIHHKLMSVSVQPIQDEDRYFFEVKPAEVPCFYHDMKYVTIRAKRGALRQKPYRRTPLSGQLAIKTEEDENVLVPLYYQDPMAKLKDVVRADGQFISSEAIEEACGDIYMTQVEKNNTILIQEPPPQHDHVEPLHPLACNICYDISDHILSCGHLCCLACANKSKRRDSQDFTCGYCAKHPVNIIPMDNPPASRFACLECGEMKMWLTGCRHLTCLCNNRSKCVVCETSITNFQKVFLAT